MREGYVPRVAAIYAAVFLYNGVQMPFLPVWFTAKGMDPALIGLVLAIPMVARMVSVPLVAREADRRDAVRAAIVLAAWASVAGHVLVGLSSGSLLIVATYALASFVYTPLLPMTDAYTLKGLAERGRAFGPVRLWGSIAFIAGNFLGGFFADAIPAADLIWPVVGSLVLIAIAASMLQPQPMPKPDPAAPPAPLWRDVKFLAVIVGASIIQASHSTFYIFSALQWHEQGLTGSAVAVLWALGVAAEIVLFAFSGRLKISPIAYILIGAAGAALRWGVMAIDPPVFVLPLLQLLHALSFGFTYLGALTYVAGRAGAGQAATAQAYFNVVASAAGGTAAALSGVLYSNFGSGSYAFMALAAVAGGACALIARRGAAIALV
jgi:MFS transporter, PPP family, 3-phenylpropionic acid transporter